MFFTFDGLGWPALLVLGSAAISHPIAILALVLGVLGKSRGGALGAGAASILLGVVALVLGVAGYLLVMGEVDSAISNADPAVRETLRAVGRGEAMINVWVGVGGAVIPLSSGAIASVRGLTVKARP